eukprot:m.184945 g.184945  ORF g.184945 m.184945 type:complete len:450 (-) comp32212_c0_seq11:361-1710(-)
MESTHTIDVCIVGGGAMGSATAYQLARLSALSVVVLEKGKIGGHADGSSHGGSRITRRTDTSDNMAALATAGLAEWKNLEKATDRVLLRRCGSIDLGDPNQTAFAGLLTQYENSPGFTILSAQQVKSRWPAFAGLPNHWRAVFNSEGGILSPDEIIPVIQNLATSHGAQFMGNSNVVRIIRRVPGLCDVVLTSGAIIRARRVVVAAGAWTHQLLRSSFQFVLPLDIWEITFAWYRVAGALGKTLAKDIPVWRAFGGSSRCYGFPLHERTDAVKIAPHGHADLCVFDTAEQRTRIPDEQYVVGVTEFARELFPEMLDLPRPSSTSPVAPSTTTLSAPSEGVELNESTCLYSVTRDGNFIIDWFDNALDVLILGGFSGSGFKHIPIVGKMAAEMLLASVDHREHDARLPPSFPNIAPFSLQRASLFQPRASDSRLTAEHERATTRAQTAKL